MKYRQAGNTGISLSILSFGGNNLAVLPDGSINEKKAIETFQYGIQEGINYADTGTYYMNSKNEEVLGKALRDFDREKFYITAKIFTPTVKSADDFEKSFNTSLERLGTDYVDFYMFHALNKEFWENIVLKFDFLDKMREVKASGKSVDLTPKEFQLLYLLVSNPGRVFSREFILDRIWGINYNGFDRSVDNIILNIRKKLGRNCKASSRISTVWGVGYKFSKNE